MQSMTLTNQQSLRIAELPEDYQMIGIVRSTPFVRKPTGQIMRIQQDGRLTAATVAAKHTLTVRRTQSGDAHNPPAGVNREDARDSCTAFRQTYLLSPSLRRAEAAGRFDPSAMRPPTGASVAEWLRAADHIASRLACPRRTRRSLPRPASSGWRAPSPVISASS